MFQIPVVEILTFVVWSCFIAYIAWYFTVARSLAPITTEEARILWRIHRKDHNCNSEEWRVIKHGNKIVGFICTCGYKYLQRRPIVGGSPPIRTNTTIPCLGHIRTDMQTVTKRTVATNPSE